MKAAKQKSQEIGMDSYDSSKQHSACFCANKSLARARFQRCSDHGNAFVCQNIIFHPSPLIWSLDYDLSRRCTGEKLANAYRATAGWRCTAISAAGEIPQVSTGFSASVLVEINLGFATDHVFPRWFHTEEIHKNLSFKNNI